MYSLCLYVCTSVHHWHIVERRLIWLEVMGWMILTNDLKRVFLTILWGLHYFTGILYIISKVSMRSAVWHGRLRQKKHSSTTEHSYTSPLHFPSLHSRKISETNDREFKILKICVLPYIKHGNRSRTTILNRLILLFWGINVWAKYLNRLKAPFSEIIRATHTGTQI